MVFNETTNYALLYLASKAKPHPDIIFEGVQNDYSLMLYLTTEHVFENFGVGAIFRLTSPWLLDMLARLSTSLRNKSCKRLGSRPKRSIKRSLSLIHSSVYISMRFHLYIFFTMFCVHSFFVFVFSSLCLFDVQMLFLNTCQKLINGVG